jgi:hypothetical protein
MYPFCPAFMKTKGLANRQHERNIQSFAVLYRTEIQFFFVCILSFITFLKTPAQEMSDLGNVLSTLKCHFSYFFGMLNYAVKDSDCTAKIFIWMSFGSSRATSTTAIHELNKMFFLISWRVIDVHPVTTGYLHIVTNLLLYENILKPISQPASCGGELPTYCIFYSQLAPATSWSPLLYSVQ